MRSCPTPDCAAGSHLNSYSPTRGKPQRDRHRESQQTPNPPAASFPPAHFRPVTVLGRQQPGPIRRDRIPWLLCQKTLSLPGDAGWVGSLVPRDWVAASLCSNRPGEQHRAPRQACSVATPITQRLRGLCRPCPSLFFPIVLHSASRLPSVFTPVRS